MAGAIRDIVTASGAMPIAGGLIFGFGMALGSFLAFAAIVAGAAPGVKYLERASVKQRPRKRYFFFERSLATGGIDLR